MASAQEKISTMRAISATPAQYIARLEEALYQADQREKLLAERLQANGAMLAPVAVEGPFVRAKQAQSIITLVSALSDLWVIINRIDDIATLANLGDLAERLEGKVQELSGAYGAVLEAAAHAGTDNFIEFEKLQPHVTRRNDGIIRVPDDQGAYLRAVVAEMSGEMAQLAKEMQEKARQGPQGRRPETQRLIAYAKQYKTSGISWPEAARQLRLDLMRRSETLDDTDRAILDKLNSKYESGYTRGMGDYFSAAVRNARRKK